MAIESMITGIQHIGIPCADLDETIRFYEGLGFQLTWRAAPGSAGNVAFLQKGTCVIETYTGAPLARANGAVDHIALNVTNIESVFAWINASETYQSLDAEIQQLPFFERGVRFFRISGPNGETVEFNQIL